jgi:hypothetical protein
VKRTAIILVTILILALSVGCGSSPATATPAPVTPMVVAVASTSPPSPTPLPTVTPLPTDTSTPRPTDTSTPVPTDIPTAKPTPSPGPTAPLPEELLEAMDAIEVEMEMLRGLDETTPITRTFMTREQLAVFLENEFAEEYSPEEVEADVRVLAAFDFVPEDFDLLGLLLALYSEQIAGFYEDEEDTFYVITGGEPGAGSMELFDLPARLTFAHEFVHGLQDEHFDLEDFISEDAFNDDEVLARLSLVEGDASLAMVEYVIAHASELTAADLETLSGEGVEAGQESLAQAPPIIRETFMFPYVYGLDFVATLQEEGWDAVDEAYADPPRSSEQILHPEKYLAGDEPQIVALPPLTDTLGAGWRLVEAETLGEFQTGLYLVQQVDQATADLASAGWDGDQYALYAQDGAEVLAFATVWDSPEDRDEFVAAYTQYAEAKYGEAASPRGEAELWWQTPAQTAVLVWGDATVWIVLGPDPETVTRTLAALREL